MNKIYNDNNDAYLSCLKSASENTENTENTEIKFD